MPQSMNRQIVLEKKLTPAGKGSARGAIWRLGQHNRRRAIKLNEVQDSKLKNVTKTLDRWKRHSEFRSTRKMSNVKFNAKELESKKRAIVQNDPTHVLHDAVTEQFKNMYMPLDKAMAARSRPQVPRVHKNKSGVYLSASKPKENSTNQRKVKFDVVGTYFNPKPDRTISHSGRTVRWYHSKI
ncbi:hypothetical protein FSP39_021732 [Pinctada imbricata]|uniref:Uncharacterized protein n=1 Tax=Pinctada imbricata TaxID=66713 RepID=A0AA89C2S4_PINIB|nr:hypothetical protein FSP39_021732 [Pinctada imbricata]